MLMDSPILDGGDDNLNDGNGHGTADAYSEVTLSGNAQTGYQLAKSPKNSNGDDDIDFYDVFETKKFSEETQDVDGMDTDEPDFEDDAGFE